MALFAMVVGDGGTVSVTADGAMHVGAPKGRVLGPWRITYYARVPPKGPGVPVELDGATLTECLLLRLVADQEVYWRNRDRRDRVRRRGKANGGGES